MIPTVSPAPSTRTGTVRLGDLQRRIGDRVGRGRRAHDPKLCRALGPVVDPEHADDRLADLPRQRQRAAASAVTGPAVARVIAALSCAPNAPAIDSTLPRIVIARRARSTSVTSGRCRPRTAPRPRRRRAPRRSALATARVRDLSLPGGPGVACSSTKPYRLVVAGTTVRSISRRGRRRRSGWRRNQSRSSPAARCDPTQTSLPP